MGAPFTPLVAVVWLLALPVVAWSVAQVVRIWWDLLREQREAQADEAILAR
jgi:hypothetical protein